jgi:hypothetical protein
MKDTGVMHAIGTQGGLENVTGVLLADEFGHGTIVSQAARWHTGGALIDPKTTRSSG